MRVLVTGGTGNVGRAAVARLVESGHQVRVIGRREGLSVEGAEYRSCDINHFDDLCEQVRGMEAVVHLAAIPTPGATPQQELFRVNCQGTFNVYQAAADERIRRVATASSINALGFNFGLQSFRLSYFPIDEQHPTFTTDPYSFSKAITEEIAGYFWRREGISSVCLRLPAVYEFSHERMERLGETAALFRERFASLMSLPAPECEERVRRAIARMDAVRDLWTYGVSHEERQERRAELRESVDVFLLFAGFGRTNFWTSIDARDSAQALEKGLLADYQGSHTLFVNDRVNALGIDSEILVRAFFPDVEERRHALQGCETLVSIERARQLLGFEPEHSIERWVQP